MNDENEIAPGIQATPGVCGGKPCIRTTRITVWGLEESRRNGWSEALILEAYPSLTHEDLANAWAYVEANREAIDAQIAENNLDEEDDA
jgi:uncharacterized protein (DUF433 family)